MKKLVFAILMMSNTVFGQVNLNSGLMAHYPFNGNASDASGNNNHPVFNNATLTPDRFGNANSAYLFNGINNYMQIPNSPTLNFPTAMSVAVWVKVNGFYGGTCHGNNILQKGNEDPTPGMYYLRFDDACYWGGFTCSNPPAYSNMNFHGLHAGPQSCPPYIVPGEWYAIVITYDGSNTRLYVNCQLRGTASGYRNFTNTHDLFLGRLNHPLYPYWLNGVLDDVRIYNRALNFAEVAAYGSTVPIIINTQPQDAAICSGSNVTFNVTAAGTGITTQWQVSTDGGVNWTNLSNNSTYGGVTTNTLTINNASVSLNNNRYRAVFSNSTSPCSNFVPSSAALLNVSQTPSVTLAAGTLSTLLPGQTTQLTAIKSAPAGGTQSLTWNYLGCGSFTAPAGNTFDVNAGTVGSYQVTLTEVFTGPALTCSSQSNVVTIDPAISSKLFIFPSPNDGRFTVSYYNNDGCTSSTIRRILIFDAKGSLVYNKSFPINGYYTLIPVDMQSASRGIYFVVVGNSAGQKLVGGKVHIR